MDYYVDTSAYTTNFVNWANVAPYEPERRQRSSTAKESQTVVAGATDFFKVVSGPSAPTAHPSRRLASVDRQAVTALAAEPKVASNAQNGAGEISEVDRIAKQRVRLMAAQYAGGNEAKEIMARLEILNNRLLDKSPRVSVEQVQALEAAASQLMQSRQAREDRMRRLGIKA